MIVSVIMECDKLTKKFGDFTAVRGFNLKLEPGTVLGFLGPNGAGKSTTMRMMIGLSVPSAGTVRLFGEDPLQVRNVRARVGYCPGELRLDDRLSVAATLKSWAKLRGRVDEEFKDNLINRFGINVDRPVRGLSTGNRRKLALVGALMARPELLILDEPTSGLDPLMQNEFISILKELTASGSSAVLSSHMLSEVDRVADRIIVIRSGEIVADGKTGELRQQATQEFRVRFATPAPNPSVFAHLSGTQAVEYSLGHVREPVGVDPSSELDQPVEWGTSGDLGELRIRWNGPPRELLIELSRYEILSFTAPEPDLETAFMSYYRAERGVTGVAPNRGESL